RPGPGMPNQSVPLWDGSIAPEKSLLVWAEQGLGDMIHCCRFASLLAERGMRVFIQAPTQLVRLMRSLRGVTGVLGPADPIPADIDAHSPVMSLPRLCGMTRLEDAPASIPYLAADASAAQASRERTRAGASLVVGV